MYYIASISSLEYKVHINCFKGSIIPPSENDMHAVLWKKNDFFQISGEPLKFNSLIYLKLLGIYL